MQKIFHKILVVLNILLAAGILLSYLSVYINPEKFWFIALFGLIYPFLLIANLIFLIYWIFRWKRVVLISLFAIGIGVFHLTSFFQFPFGKESGKGKTDLVILSYNVNLFRLYSWSSKPPTYNEIINFSDSYNPDIICYQEFYTSRGKFSGNNARKLLEMNAHIGYIVQKRNSGYGIATFTKHPIVDRGEIKFENTSNACIYTDIKIGKDTVRVYNNHLQSLRLKERNFNFLLNEEFRQGSNKLVELKDISFKLRDAFRKRAIQVNKVADHISKCRYPVIVCGDFNDSPISYTYYKMSKTLNDTFREVGIGIANTYMGLIPSYRIDYILHSKHLKAIRYSSPRVNYSDHYPVIGYYKWVNKKK